MNESGVMVWEGRSGSVEQTMALGAAVAEVVRQGDVIALIGELGAGKTQFVRGLARGMGLGEQVVSSPTFVMVNEYLDEQSDRSLVHIDAYRVTTLDELESIGWDFGGDAMREGAVVVLEWADRLDGALSDDLLQIELGHVSDEERAARISAMGDWQLRVPVLREKIEATMAGKPAGDGTTLKCPTCGGAVSDSAETFPFCSVRCKQVDLGKWFGEEYKVSRPIEEADLDEE